MWKDDRRRLSHRNRRRRVSYGNLKQTGGFGLKISIFAPYSYGSYETHKILDRIVTAMLYSQKLYTVTSCESGGVHYVRDTGALVLDTYFTLSKVFPNRHTQKGL